MRGSYARPFPNLGGVPKEVVMAISPFPKQGQGFRAEVKISENMDLILNGLVWTRICVGNLRCKGERVC